MESMDKRSKRFDVIIFTTIILVLTALLLGNYFCIMNYNEVKNQNTEYKNKLKENKDSFSEIEKTYTEIDKNIVLLNNIDTEIQNSKKNYYKTLKEFEDKVSNGEVNHKIAYLTFDDGPYNLTHSFLKILNDYNVRATFFTIGLDKEICYDDRSKFCGNVYFEIYNQGHTLANHTYSHQIFNGLYSSSDRFIWDVKKQEELIKNKTGHITNIVRFPGGSASAGYLKNDMINKLKENGYGWVDWTCMNGDGGYVPNASVAMENFKKGIDENIEVVLLHDYSYITVSILPDIIKYLKDNNYTLLPLFYESKMVNK